jgi:hypothetical protein
MTEVLGQMVIIANPIYDVVFKYLMANLDIARGIISTIIDEDIDMLDFKAQEQVYKFKDTDLKDIEPEIDVKQLIYFHLDFIARIKQESGDYKNVLIELQKTYLSHDLMRFRRYMGEQYKKEDEVVRENGSVSRGPLPIITIYFLGNKISETLPAVIKVNRTYIDVLGGGKEIKERSDFIECLSHNSYVIQIPSLRLELKTELEKVLSIFQQENFIDPNRHTKRYEHEPEGELMNKILKRLQQAAADSELHKQLEVEDAALHEFEISVKRLVDDIEQKKKELELKDKELAQKDLQIKETAKQMLLDGMPVEKVARYTGLAEKEVKALMH